MSDRDADSAADQGGPAADVACRASDGSERPMREVLAERRRLYLQRPKAEREEAYRVRAGIIGDLHACFCSWPVVIADTASGHEPWCTAHRHIETAPARVEGTPRSATVHFVVGAGPCPSCRRERYHLDDCPRSPRRREANHDAATSGEEARRG